MSQMREDKRVDIHLRRIGTSTPLHLLTHVSPFENIRPVSAPDVSAGYLGV